MCRIHVAFLSHLHALIKLKLYDFKTLEGDTETCGEPRMPPPSDKKLPREDVRKEPR